jgi:energy-coupling factor transporter ATP-binding protein EcfA2
VANYASVRDEQELSLVALDEHPDLAVTPVPRSELHVLPVVGIYGPNGSGKSSVLKALSFAAEAVSQSHQYWLPDEPIPRWPFRLDATSRDEPSTFVFEFVLEGTRYEYGFSLDDRTIREEWLFTWPRGRRAVLFEADSMDVTYGSALSGRKAEISSAARENSLFLSAAAAFKHPQLAPIADWLARIGFAASRHISGLLPFEPDAQLIDLLRYADIGVIGSVLAERDFTDEGLSTRQRRSRKVTASHNAPGYELTHRASNGSGFEALPWRWESAGTQAWTWLAAAAIDHLHHGRPMLVDDLGSTLHPALTAQLVGLFQRRETNPHGAQLLFTSHDVSLLGRHLDHRLRRDQVWLTEKSTDGASRLYPLTEYGRVRDGVDDVEGRYLQGRYGAVPFFDPALLDQDGAADAEG